MDIQDTHSYGGDDNTSGSVLVRAVSLLLSNAWSISRSLRHRLIQGSLGRHTNPMARVFLLEKRSRKVSGIDVVFASDIIFLVARRVMVDLLVLHVIVAKLLVPRVSSEAVAMTCQDVVIIGFDSTHGRSRGFVGVAAGVKIVGILALIVDVHTCIKLRVPGPIVATFLSIVLSVTVGKNM